MYLCGRCPKATGEGKKYSNKKYKLENNLLKKTTRKDFARKKIYCNKIYEFFFLLAVIGHRGDRKPPTTFFLQINISKADYKRTELRIPQNFNQIVTIVILCHFCYHFCRLDGVVVNTIVSAEQKVLGSNPVGSKSSCHQSVN